MNVLSQQQYPLLLDQLKDIPWEQNYLSTCGSQIRKPITHFEINVSWDNSVQGYVTNYGTQQAGQNNVHFFYPETIFEETFSMFQTVKYVDLFVSSDNDRSAVTQIETMPSNCTEGILFCRNLFQNNVQGIGEHFDGPQLHDQSCITSKQFFLAFLLILYSLCCC
jgi:hypothetical protein